MLRFYVEKIRLRKLVWNFKNIGKGLVMLLAVKTLARTKQGSIII